jgi:hypothetical protein
MAMHSIATAAEFVGRDHSSLTSDSASYRVWIGRGMRAIRRWTPKSRLRHLPGCLRRARRRGIGNDRSRRGPRSGCGGHAANSRFHGREARHPLSALAATVEEVAKNARYDVTVRRRFVRPRFRACLSLGCATGLMARAFGYADTPTSVDRHYLRSLPTNSGTSQSITAPS